jgi:hypothetical protein
VIFCHSREIGNILLLLSHEILIYMDNWRPDGTGWMDLDSVGQQSGALVAFVPPVSIKNRSLHWIP